SCRTQWLSAPPPLGPPHRFCAGMGWAQGSGNANSSLRRSVLASFSAVKGRLVVSCFARYFCASVPIPKFASPCGTILCELRNQRDTSKLMTLVWFLDLKFLCEFAVYS